MPKMAASDSSPAPFELHTNKKFSLDQHSRLYDLQQSSSLTDFTIRVGDQRLLCHQVVLAAVCPYFDALLRTGMKESQKAEVSLDCLDCLDFALLQEVVKYCYTGNISVQFENLKNLVIACDFLQLDDLKELCANHIIGELQANNCISWCQFANVYSMESLSTAAENMMCSQFVKVCDCEEFKDLSLAEVIDYVKNDKIQVHSENATLSAIIDWVLSDKESRQNDFAHLLEHVALKNCTAGYLRLVSVTHVELFQCENVQTHLNEAFMALALGQDKVSGRAFQKGSEVPVLCGGIRKNGATVGLSNDCTYYKSKWQSFTNIPQTACLKYASICLTQDGILVSGGGKGTSGVNICNLYDLRAKAWITLPNMMSSRFAHWTGVVDESVYVIGGRSDKDTPVNSVEALSLSNMKWQEMSKLIHPVFLPIVTVLDMSIYVFLSKCKANSEVEKKHGITLQICDTIKNKWRFGAKLPEGRDSTSAASAVAAKGMVYLVGGGDKLCNRYDPITNSWTILNPPLNFHIYGPAVLINDKISLVGGSTGVDVDKTMCDKISEYDIVTDSWSTAKFRCPQPVRDHFVLTVPLSLLQ